MRVDESGRWRIARHANKGGAPDNTGRGAKVTGREWTSGNLQPPLPSQDLEASSPRQKSAELGAEGREESALGNQARPQDRQTDSETLPAGTGEGLAAAPHVRRLTGFCSGAPEGWDPGATSEWLASRAKFKAPKPQQQCGNRVGAGPQLPC